MFIWYSNSTIYPIHLVANNLFLINTYGTDFIADVILSLSALMMQMGLRLYLRYVEQITESNEILSKKIILLLLLCNVSFFLPLPATSHEFLPPYAFVFATCPTLVLYDHFGFRTFFMENHPKLNKAYLVLGEFSNTFLNRVQPSPVDIIV